MVRLFTTADTSQQFRSFQGAVNYTMFRNIKTYCIVTKSFDVYYSVSSRWTFKNTEKEAFLAVGSLLTY